MEISTPNNNGVLDEGYREIVAQHGRWNASVQIAFCEDGLYRYSVSFIYSYGGCSGPIFLNSPGMASLVEARMAALNELLRHVHRPLPFEPQSACDELRSLRDQIEQQIQQPTFL